MSGKNKQVEKLKRGQKQRVYIIRVVNNEKMCYILIILIP